jgi:hypothetical protein
MGAPPPIYSNKNTAGRIQEESGSSWEKGVDESGHATWISQDLSYRLCRGEEEKVKTRTLETEGGTRKTFLLHQALATRLGTQIR